MVEDRCEYFCFVSFVSPGLFSVAECPCVHAGQETRGLLSRTFEQCNDEKKQCEYYATVAKGILCGMQPSPS